MTETRYPKAKRFQKMTLYNHFRLLVGAPEADARQPGVHKGGAVYKCSATQPGNCNIIPFDMRGNAPKIYVFFSKIFKFAD